MLIHELAQKFLAQGYNIFGGYVRDLISGDEPKDIDVMMEKENFFLFIKAFLPEWDVAMYYDRDRSIDDDIECMFPNTEGDSLTAMFLTVFDQ